MADENDSTAFDLRALQEAFGAWHVDTFGEALPPIRILAPQADQRGSCLIDEVDELLEAAEGRDRDAKRYEAADVGLCLLAYAEREGFDLLTAMIDKYKIVIRRSRERVLR